MTDLLYSATDKNKKFVANYINCNSIEQATQKLELEGFNNIIFHNDCLFKNKHDQLPHLSNNQLKKMATFEINLKYKNSLLKTLVQTINVNQWFFLLLFSLLAVSVYQQKNLTITFIVIILLFPLIVSAWRYRSVSCFNHLYKAEALGNWQNVLNLGKELKSLNKLGKQVDSEADFQIAKALIRLDQKESAVNLMQSWQLYFNELSPGFYESRLSSLYAASQDYNAYLEMQRKSYEANPNEMTSIDLAMAEVKYGQKERAKLLVDEVNEKNISQIATYVLLWVKGLISIESNSNQSIHLLKQATDGLLEMRENPIAWIIIAMCSADYAIQLYHLGEKNLSRSILKPFTVIIKVHADKDVQKLCAEIVSNK